MNTYINNFYHKLYKNKSTVHRNWEKGVALKSYQTKSKMAVAFSRNTDQVSIKNDLNEQ